MDIVKRLIMNNAWVATHGKNGECGGVGGKPGKSGMIKILGVNTKSI
jgi:hypothetical protein